MRVDGVKRVPCGCGDYEVFIPEGTLLPSIDVVCPKCGNHFGIGENTDVEINVESNA